MNKKRIITNIFSNWANFIALIVVSFFVSPILVHQLGNENYGIWVLIVSLTGYFTVLDFGVNSAIVRFISMYVANNETRKANEIYNTSFVFFSVVSVLVLLVASVFAYFFRDLFGITALEQSYLYLVFMMVGIDLAFGFLCSVFLGTLRGLQEFLKINMISISTLLLKNAVLVLFLFSGYKLLALAIIQLSFNLLKYSLQYLVIRKKYTFLQVHRANYRRSMLKQIYHYSIYSFIISIALKLLFYTDSVVIGSLLTVSKITFYAIPATLMQYMEKFIYAAISVLTPVISSYDAMGEGAKNRNIYVLGSRYALMLSIPVLFVLYTNGMSFISLWMGPEYGRKCSNVLKILVIGYTFAFPQMIANGILKGTSKHKVFAYILIVEAIANLALSIILVRVYDIEGVALGTTLPLIITNLILVPLYTCRTLELKYGTYLWRSYATPSVLLVLLACIYYARPIETASYTALIYYSAGVTFIVAVFSLIYIVDKTHRDWLFQNLKKYLFPRRM